VTGDEDRIGYLAGDGPDDLDAEERVSLDELRSLLADPALWAEPSPDLGERIVSSISGQSGPGPSASRPGPQISPGRTGKPRSRRIILIAGAAAAAVAVVVGISLGLASSTNKPLRFHAALAPTSLAPGASGHATLTRTEAGWRVDLRATGLARLDNGAYYEAWLKNPAGTLVPIGTFNQGPAVTLWAGVSPQDFPVLTITKQLANGNPASSGLRVLVGPVR
jgi:Anti-sigma-K factor rskA, C-terminal